MTRKRVHWGQTPFLVNDDPEISQLTNNGVSLTQLWVIFRVNLTDFRVIVDPEWSLAQWTLFRFTLTRVFLEWEFSYSFDEEHNISQGRLLCHLKALFNNFFTLKNLSCMVLNAISVIGKV